MRNLLRLMHEWLKLRGWIALCLIVAAAVWLPQVLPTHSVTERRAAFRLERAQEHLASGEFDQAETDLPPQQTRIRTLRRRLNRLV